MGGVDAPQTRRDNGRLVTAGWSGRCHDSERFALSLRPADHPRSYCDVLINRYFSSCSGHLAHIACMLLRSSLWSFQVILPRRLTTWALAGPILHTRPPWSLVANNGYSPDPRLPGSHRDPLVCKGSPFLNASMLSGTGSRPCPSPSSHPYHQ